MFFLFVWGFFAPKALFLKITFGVKAPGPRHKPDVMNLLDNMCESYNILEILEADFYENHDVITK